MARSDKRRTVWVTAIAVLWLGGWGAVAWINSERAAAMERASSAAYVKANIDAPGRTKADQLTYLNEAVADLEAQVRAGRRADLAFAAGTLPVGLGLGWFTFYGLRRRTFLPRRERL